MNNLKVVRKEIEANELTEFNFDIKGYEFIVVNFSVNDIFVSFRETEDTDKMIKIPAGMSRNCLISKDTTNAENSTDTLYVLSEDESEVEVQCVRF